LDVNINAATNKVEAVVTRTDGGKFSCTPDPNNKNGSLGNNVPSNQWPPDYVVTDEYLQSIVVDSDNGDISSITIRTDFKKDAAGKILMASVYDENGNAFRKRKRTTQTTKDSI
jgi:hypothetical protein